MPLVSVVLPAFNPQTELLRRALASVLSQTLPDLEVVLVDDGSEPEIRVVIEKLASTDGRVRVFRQENRGVSAARNRGLDEANGQYLAFLDADDYLSPQYLASAADAAVRNKAGIVFGGLSVHTKSGRAVWRTLDAAQGRELVLDRHRVDRARSSVFAVTPSFLEDSPAETFPNVVGAIYDRDVVEGLRFPEGVRHGEDRVFNFQALGLARTVAVIDEVWYTYDRTHESGVTQGFSASRVPELCATVRAFTEAARDGAMGAPELLASALEAGAAEGVLNFVKLGALVCAQERGFGALRELRQLVSAAAQKGTGRQLRGLGIRDSATAWLVRLRLPSVLLLLAKLHLRFLGEGNADLAS